MIGALSFNPKVSAALLATWLTTLIVYTLHTWAHVDLPAEVAAALTGLIGFLAGWLAPTAARA